jgi:2-haloacid dehalogenase
MLEVRQRRRPWTALDDLHHENLVALLEAEGIGGLTAAELDHLNRAWHRLDPWPDTVAGLARLKRRYILATLSNGNVALIVAMAKRAGLPWDVVLGAEVAGAYKPEDRAYDRAAELLRLAPEQVMMVAAHADDLEFASARGFRTGYVHRPMEFGPHAVPERPAPGTFDVMVDSFEELAEALGT